MTREDPTSQIAGRPAWTLAGQLLFGHAAGGDLELMTTNAAGGRVRQLTHNFLTDREPAWSPDGARVAFVRDIPVAPGRTDPEIYVMRADGSHVRRLTRHAGEDVTPAWSPDGKQIVFARRVFPTSVGLAVMSADGAHVRVLVSQTSGFVDSPSWSPDGKQIVFVSVGGPRRLSVVDADGTDLHPLIAGDAYDETDPDWSPDGQRILFVRHNPCGGNCDVPSLVTIRPDGTDEQTISAFSELEQPSWSPDGTMIVAPGGGSQGMLTIVDMKGTVVRRIRPVTTEISGPAWQPLN